MKINHFIIIILFISCQVDLVKKPKNLIDKNKMTLIMQDMILIKSISKKYQNVIHDENWFGDIYIYEKYKIDSLILVQSQDYYAKSPKIYLKIHNQIKSNINKMIDSIGLLSKEEARKIKEKNFKKNDSLKLKKGLI